ncbi:MAG: LPS-assembly protein LptD, partial [Ramlibacter sp.]
MHHLTPRAAHARFALTPVALVACALLQAVPARAQAQEEPSPHLKASPMLREAIPAAVRRQLPTFVTGDSISGRTDLETVIEGSAVLRRGSTVIRADRLEYDQP